MADVSNVAGVAMEAGVSMEAGVVNNESMEPSLGGGVRQSMLTMKLLVGLGAALLDLYSRDLLSVDSMSSLL